MLGSNISTHFQAVFLGNKKPRKPHEQRRKWEIILFACQSFAWFTSKDEVTNRLTANSDYGVSIVESFTPPENLLPGQEVNKDVYAVNTGNIDAFVKENIKGVLNYTYESKVNTWDKDCVKLTLEQAAAIEGATTEDGFKTMEAGGYLAWTDTSLATGPLYSGRTQDLETPWYPTETGVYIFRRSIGGTNDNPTFTYAGYYFVKGAGTGDGADPSAPTDDTYYKIVIGNDAFRYNTGTTYQFDVAVPDTALCDGTGAALTVGTEENDDIDPDTGVINSETLKVSYVKETEVEDEGVTFTYEAASGTRTYDRLKVEYTAVATDDGTYDASAAAARAEVDYANAKKFSDSADKWATQANAEYAYVKKLVEETNKLYAKANAAKTASDNLSAAVTDRQNAWTDLNGAATTLETDIGTWLTAATTTATTAIDPANANFLPANVVAAAGLQTNGTDYDYPQVHQNYTELVALYDSMFGTTGYVKNIQDAIDAIQAINDDTSATPETRKAAINAQLAIIDSNLASLKTALAQYKLKYADLINQAVSDTTITIETAEAVANAQKAKIQTVLDGVNGTITGDVNTLHTEANDYITEYTDWYNANDTFTAAQTAWTNAVSAYNSAVGTAKSTYDAAVNAGTGAGDNHGTTIVPAYSANGTASNDDPTIAAGANDYATYALADKVLPATSAYNVGLHLTDETGEITVTSGVATQSVDAWNTLKSNKNTAATTAKAAYDDAVAALTSGSTITLYVNLADDYATYWQIEPDDQPSSTDVDFYLKKILAAGETSHKLVDSITFADSVTANDYKNLTFDLNVGLDSAQITYADDQRTITTDAVVAPFAMTPQVTQADRTVAWS